MPLDLARLRRLRLFDPATELKVPSGQSVYDPAVFGRYDRATQKVVSAREDDGAWTIGLDELMFGARDHAREWPDAVQRDRCASCSRPAARRWDLPGRVHRQPRAESARARRVARVPLPADRHRGRRLTVQREDVTALSMADGSVARIMSLDTLEHVERYPQALREFHRVLAPGGVLIVHVPVYFYDRRESAPLEPDNDPWGHVRYFSARELVGEVVGAGFALLRAQFHLDYGAALCVAGKPA